ncbi:MAG: hypothetical protein V4479_08020 [Actinomycetota bacterium]
MATAVSGGSADDTFLVRHWERAYLVGDFLKGTIALAELSATAAIPLDADCSPQGTLGNPALYKTVARDSKTPTQYAVGWSLIGDGAFPSPFPEDKAKSITLLAPSIIVAVLDSKQKKVVSVAAATMYGSDTSFLINGHRGQYRYALTANGTDVIESEAVDYTPNQLKFTDALPATSLCNLLRVMVFIIDTASGLIAAEFVTMIAALNGNDRDRKRDSTLAVGLLFAVTKASATSVCAPAN